MSRYYKSLQAGRYCMAIAYSRPTLKDTPKARAEKHRHSSRAQKQLNDKASLLQLTAIIAEEFSDSHTAFFVSPTFDEAHYPDFEKQSQYWDYVVREMNKFIDRLRRLAKKRGQDLKCVRSPGIGKGGRWHGHMVIDGVTQEDLVACWQLGGIDCHRLYSDTGWLSDREWYSKGSGVNPVAIAKYMMSNAACRLIGKHPWYATRNCRRPAVTPARVVHDATAIDPPDGAYILTQERVETLYSSYIFIEYLLPDNRPADRRRKRSAAARGRTP